jgi:membrane protease YdiL (CAAX protease family)
MGPVKIWTVFVTYALAAIAAVVFSGFAGALLHALDPDVTPAAILEGLRGLLAAHVASSLALVLTAFMATRGMTPARLRLVPGREGGRHLLVMLSGMLALSLALDSLVMLFGLARTGAMEVVRKTLAAASGLELFAAVVVIGFVAAPAEELFFRGYMQSMLRERWRPASAVVGTSVCFGLLHVDLVYVAVAAVLGLYLGFVTELSGSALPAVACHTVNNAVSTLAIALLPPLAGTGLNLVLVGLGTLVAAGAVVWLRRSLPVAGSPS